MKNGSRHGVDLIVTVFYASQRSVNKIMNTGRWTMERYEPTLMFNADTGEIKRFDLSIYSDLHNLEWLIIQDGYTPYYTLDGLYFGCKCRFEYRTPDGRYFGSYEDLIQ